MRALREVRVKLTLFDGEGGGEGPGELPAAEASGETGAAGPAPEPPAESPAEEGSSGEPSLRDRWEALTRGEFREIWEEETAWARQRTAALEEENRSLRAMVEVMASGQGESMSPAEAARRARLRRSAEAARRRRSRRAEG